MQRKNGDVDEQYLSILRFTERINIGLLSWVGYDFNEFHGVTRDGVNHDFGDYF